MNKYESAILEAKTPEDYIDKSLKAKLSPAAKARLARIWMKATGYTKVDILRARNRHPYWKRKKMEGSTERTRRRLSAHDYSGGASVAWNRELVAEFLSLNDKDSDGRYEHKDWELAERFGATIPSIQYMRRKYSKVQRLLGSRASADKMVEYLMRAESVLSRGKGAVEKLQKAELGQAAAERSAKAGGTSAKAGGTSAKAVPARKAASAPKTAKAKAVRASKPASTSAAAAKGKVRTPAAKGAAAKGKVRTPVAEASGLKTGTAGKAAGSRGKAAAKPASPVRRAGGASVKVVASASGRSAAGRARPVDKAAAGSGKPSKR